MLTLENSQDLARFLLQRDEAIRFLACTRERFLHHHWRASVMSMHSAPLVMSIHAVGHEVFTQLRPPGRADTLALALVLTVLPRSERLLRKLSMTTHSRGDHHELRVFVREEALGSVVPLRRRVVVGARRSRLSSHARRCAPLEERVDREIRDREDERDVECARGEAVAYDTDFDRGCHGNELREVLLGGCSRLRG